jgi:hypothetical protein
MILILLCTTIGFAISAILFAIGFSRATTLGWILAVIANTPNLLLLSYLLLTMDSANLHGIIILGGVVAVGGGGFGLGAIVGMSIAMARSESRESARGTGSTTSPDKDGSAAGVR